MWTFGGLTFEILHEISLKVIHPKAFELVFQY
jgi:hypothetical protein